MKLVPIALFFLLVASVGSLVGQDTVAYVTRLTAVPGAQSVLLTWKDAEGHPTAQYEIWRSEKEIVKDGLSSAKLVTTVKAGVEAFEDTSVASPSFYLVLLRDEAGNRQGFYIPFKNKTTTAVKPDASASMATARIKMLSLTYANPQVLVAFSALPADRKLVVFRRASPITSVGDLKDATLLGNTTGSQSPWKDTPAPGLEFYYAVLDAQAFADGKSDAFDTENATDKPAGFPLVSAGTGLDSTLRPGLDPSTRALPLPRLQVGTEPDSGRPMVPAAYEPIAARDLRPATEAALKAWAKPISSAGSDLPAPMVLAEERSASQEGAGRYLVQIQKAYLDAKDWKGGQEALESLLKLTMDSRTQARARFYLGQTLAFQKNYQRAFLEMLSARELYPQEANLFLEALFSLLAP